MWWSPQIFGDIPSDGGPACTGTIGIAPSGNINPDGDFPSLFEPVHGSAPDIAGMGIANPVGQVWAGAMMLEHLQTKAVIHPQRRFPIPCRTAVCAPATWAGMPTPLPVAGRLAERACCVRRRWPVPGYKPGAMKRILPDRFF